MMGVLHCDTLRVKVVLTRQFLDFSCIIICHQEVTLKSGSDTKEFFMIQVSMRIETTTGAFPTSSIRRVNKKDGICLMRIFLQHCHSIAFKKANPVTHIHDIDNALLERLWIPARLYPFVVFTILYSASTMRQNAAAINPILKDCLKSPLYNRICRRSKCRCNRFSCQIKAYNLLC